MENKWSLFKLRVNIRRPLDKVYAAWATPGGLESWFLRRAEVGVRELSGSGMGSGPGEPGPPGIHRLPAESMESGDHYTWNWHGYAETAMAKGRIIAANGVDHFAFTFSLGCPVSVSLYRELDETIVELVESELPSDEETMLRHYVGDLKGWTFYLTNLKSVLEGGPDLRNRRAELTNVITA
jgi:uncharacterized protein YndB with AHSA1/START domain